MDSSKREDHTNEFIQTKDGTITLADKDTGEWYHNSAGAHRESFENYAKPALELLESIDRAGKKIEAIRILDICFGLGYNTFSFLNYLVERKIPVDTVTVLAIENDETLIDAMSKTINQDCYKQLKESQFASLESKLNLSELFETVHIDREDLGAKLSGKFKSLNHSTIGMLEFDLLFGDLRQVVPNVSRTNNNTFDLVFHDPFSPAKFPQFWTINLFEHYRKLLIEKTGMLFTYSVATAVRSALVQSGFSIYRTASVGAKSGGTLAVSNLPPVSESKMNSCIPNNVDEILANEKTPDEIVFALDDDEVSRILSSSGIPYRDPELNLDRISILKARDLEINEFKSKAARA